VRRPWPGNERIETTLSPNLRGWKKIKRWDWEKEVRNGRGLGRDRSRSSQVKEGKGKIAESGNYPVKELGSERDIPEKKTGPFAPSRGRRPLFRGRTRPKGILRPPSKRGDPPGNIARKKDARQKSLQEDDTCPSPGGGVRRNRGE